MSGCQEDGDSNGVGDACQPLEPWEVIWEVIVRETTGNGGTFLENRKQRSRFAPTRGHRRTLALAESYPEQELEPTSGIEPLTC